MVLLDGEDKKVPDELERGDVDDAEQIDEDTDDGAGVTTVPDGPVRKTGR